MFVDEADGGPPDIRIGNTTPASGEAMRLCSCGHGVTAGIAPETDDRFLAGPLIALYMRKDPLFEALPQARRQNATLRIGAL